MSAVFSLPITRNTAPRTMSAHFVPYRVRLAPSLEIANARDRPEDWHQRNDSGHAIGDIAVASKPGLSIASGANDYRVRIQLKKFADEQHPGGVGHGDVAGKKAAQSILDESLVGFRICLHD